MPVPERSAPQRFPWLPDVHWPVTERFWEGCRHGELRFPRCDGCGSFTWYPVSHCPACHRKAFSWVAVSGHGHVHSLTVLRRAFLEGFEHLLPLDLLQVRFPDAPGVTLVTNLAEPDERQGLGIGSAVRIVFVPVDDEVTMPLASVIPE
jgi:uncharacterized OB-fold protein